ncbi:deoxyribodipyrimidine photo-lyase [Dysgonomonas alginatilytica]|uniref:Deoxyribodipyrimidine photo-lyase n=1 Tax=Dysgonomonas alginatilytica TaxID=1605892 RepID=A0A2V3PSM3_9BACT|nr:deoxyribodipyrimidine photo-lyase [Dysgonomonas alginatilytica]PXV68197.1 deoxyribodipyrimidine photo-lyase [Dysgonomonas alginatilytica]
MKEISIFWFRRDFSIDDNAGLFHALKQTQNVMPIFIFDPNILNMFEKPLNRQVQFIYDNILRLNDELQCHKSSILVSYDQPLNFFQNLASRYRIKAVYTNEDYELAAIKRDQEVEEYLKTKSILFYSFKNQVIFSKDDILKSDGRPYTIFTPYSRKWKETFKSEDSKMYDCKVLYNNLYRFESNEMPTLDDLGFSCTKLEYPQIDISDDLIRDYGKYRDFPALEATSHLGVHLRFGTCSIRKLVERAKSLGEVFLNELIWREFYQSITYHFPHIAKGLSFNKKYDNIIWRDNEDEFAAWCAGKTGYPIVDAGMRQLNATGFMHNRTRMITASFLVKHLLIDWRWGEAYFANKLLDFDFASNNGGWQWCAGSGCDASPYFRVFNPELQTKKFDRNMEYVKRWVPELGTNLYPKPLVDHDYARKRAIEIYKNALTVER